MCQLVVVLGKALFAVRALLKKLAMSCRIYGDTSVGAVRLRFLRQAILNTLLLIMLKVLPAEKNIGYAYEHT